MHKQSKITSKCDLKAELSVEYENILVCTILIESPLETHHFTYMKM